MNRVAAKKIAGNLFWVVLLMVFLFTPLGFHLKVFFARLFAVSPSELAIEDQKLLLDNTWELTNLEGEVIGFSAFQGQVVLVNFWATWCPPCIAEIPSFEELYNDYAGEVAFVFIANDDPLKVARFVNENALTLPIYFERNTTPGQLTSKSIPSSYIIDKSGKIVLTKIGVADWDSEGTRMLLNRLLTD